MEIHTAEPAGMEAGTPASSLRIALLGGFRVERGGEALPDEVWQRPRAKVLVKLLATVPGHALHREQVQELLWPDLDPDAAHGSFRKALFLARRALEPTLGRRAASSYLRFQSDVLTLNRELVQIDADRFEQRAREGLLARDIRVLEAAVDLYGGDLLPEDRYEEWARSRAETLAGLFVDVLQALAGALHAEGRLDEARERLLQVLERDSLREDVHRDVMRLHATQGRRHQAMRQYQICRQVLCSELDATPETATEELYDAIRAGRSLDGEPVGQPAERVRSGTRGGSAASLLPSAIRSIPSTPFVGRDRPLEVILACLATRRDRGGEGSAGVVLVSGEAGVGKSRLVAEVARTAAARGTPVLWGGCYEQEGSAPYGPIAEALEEYVAALPDTEREACAAAYPELTHLLPSLRSAGPAVRRMQTTDRSHLFAGVAGLLRALAPDHALLLVLDDLHLADMATLQLLHYLARTLAGSAILVLGTYREEETEGDLAQTVRSLQRTGLAQRVELLRLGRAECELLVRGLLPGGLIAPSVLQEVFMLSLGSPLFATEIVRVLREEGGLRLEGGEWTKTDDWSSRSREHVPVPEQVRGLVLRRVDRLGEDAGRVLALAAVAGMESDFDLLLRGTACAFPGVLSEERLLDSLDRALGARLLEEHGDGYAFRHPLFREALYAQLSRQRRTRLHGAVALALAARGSEDMEALAHHFDRGGQPDRAVHYLELAGDRAAAVYAYGAAMGHYARAAALAESNGRLPLMLKLGAIYQLVGKWTEAEALYRDALMRAASVEDERAIARSRMALGHVLQQRGAYTEALEELRLAEAELDRLGDRVGLAEVNGVLATVYRQQGQYTHSQSCGERQLAIGTELEDQHIVAEALVNVGTAFARQAKYTEAMTAYERYLLLVEALGDRAGIQQAMGWIGNVHRKLGDLSQALAHFRRQLQLARELSLLPQEGVALGNIALVHEEQADYSAALAHLEQALEIFRCIGDRQRESVALGNIGAALCNLDEHRHAFSKILDALRIAEELGDNRSVALNLANLADLYRRQGRYDDALACIGAATSMVEDLKSPHDLAEALIGLARIFLSRQQGDAAGSVLRRVIPLCRALSISSVLSGALHISAELALRDHRLDEAADLSSESLKLAIEAGRKDIELDAHVLCLRIGVARGIMSAPEAAANLSQIASVWPQERDQAALHYQIWQFDPSLHGHVESAATAYRRLWTKSGALEYRRRYEELTGESLSDAEALPAPPSAALRGSIDLAELLRGADTLIATVEGQAETGALVS